MRPARPYLLSLLALSAWLSLAQQPENSLDSAAHKLYKRSDIENTRQLYKRSPEKDDSSSSKSKSKDQGTKDAPIDGADGKPHAGPFVETTDSDAKKDQSKSSKEKSSQKEKPSPEDGVMNDRSRNPPKKGTTGTEGGVSEKSKNREDHESETGRKVTQKPESPKDKDSVAHKETDAEEAKKSEKSKAGKNADKSGSRGSKSDDKDEKPKGAMSMEV